MATKPRASLSAEIEAEKTAADYIGKPAARKLAQAGYFREQVARGRAPAHVNPPERPRYEARKINGGVVSVAGSLDALVEKVEREHPDLIVEVFRVDNGRHKEPEIGNNWKIDQATRKRAWIWK